MQSYDYKYIKIVYHVIRNAMLDKTTCTNWCSLSKHVLQSLGVLDAREYQTSVKGLVYGMYGILIPCY